MAGDEFPGEPEEPRLIVKVRLMNHGVQFLLKSGIQEMHEKVSPIEMGSDISSCNFIGQCRRFCNLIGQGQSCSMTYIMVSVQ